MASGSYGLVTAHLSSHVFEADGTQVGHLRGCILKTYGVRFLNHVRENAGVFGPALWSMSRMSQEACKAWSIGPKVLKSESWQSARSDENTAM